MVTDEINPWQSIPLDDYESHMSHDSVVQSQLLNELTKKYLQKHNPERPLFLGVSGGNGLEHVDVNKVKTVYGIDINQSYLDETKKRFAARIKDLVLIKIDISTSTESLFKADFVWAALIFEYVDIQKGFEFIANNTTGTGNVVITIQSNNGSQSVSQTGIESIKSVKDLFKVVDADFLKAQASQVGYGLIHSEESYLPSGKSFGTYEFKRS